MVKTTKKTKKNVKSKTKKKETRSKKCSSSSKLPTTIEKVSHELSTSIAYTDLHSSLSDSIFKDSFDKFLGDRCALHQCRKIGEGVYGEVFMNKTDAGRAVVLKIIPIEGSLEVNGEPQKKFDEILSEIVIALQLSSLRNDKEYMTSSFAEVVQVRCVQGRYPNHLIDLWELELLKFLVGFWYRDNYQTENDHPEIFTDDQLYIVFELANGGQDLEAFQFMSSLAIQTAAIACLVLTYSGGVSKAYVFLTFYSTICYVLMGGVAPIEFLWSMQAFNIPILVLGKLSQAWTNYKNGSTGQLSVITCFMLFFGSLARIFTSIQETGDIMMIMTFCFSAASNGVIVLQCLYYWNVSKPKIDQKSVKTDIKTGAKIKSKKVN